MRFLFLSSGLDVKENGLFLYKTLKIYIFH